MSVSQYLPEKCTQRDRIYYLFLRDSPAYLKDIIFFDETLTSPLLHNTLLDLSDDSEIDEKITLISKLSKNFEKTMDATQSIMSKRLRNDISIYGKDSYENWKRNLWSLFKEAEKNEFLYFLEEKEMNLVDENIGDKKIKEIALLDSFRKTITKCLSQSFFSFYKKQEKERKIFFISNSIYEFIYSTIDIGRKSVDESMRHLNRHELHNINEERHPFPMHVISKFSSAINIRMDSLGNPSHNEDIFILKDGKLLKPNQNEQSSLSSFFANILSENRKYSIIKKCISEKIYTIKRKIDRKPNKKIKEK